MNKRGLQPLLRASEVKVGAKGHYHGPDEEDNGCSCEKFREATVLVTLLKGCGKLKDLYKGRRLHDDILKRGLLKENIYVGNALLNMYAKCGDLAKALQVLDELPVRDVVTWTALIAGYTQHGDGEEALNCFERMQSEGISPNEVTFACILKACSTTGAAEKGKRIHAKIAKGELLGANTMLGNALVNMYVKCGEFAKARQVFDELSVRDVVSWTVLIAGYTEHRLAEEALSCFNRMQSEGLSPNAVTFACVLKACSIVGAVEKGKEIHFEIVREGLLGKDVVLGNALVDMYATCGALVQAQEVFDELPIQDLLSWTALIAGYTHHGHAKEALNYFERMQRNGLSPDAVTFACILKACGSIGAAEKGEEIHAKIVREGLLGKKSMLGNALVDMYAKCGALVKAQQVFDKLPVQNVVSWNVLIAGYTQHGHFEEALNRFECMRSKGLSPDSVTFTCILKACGSLGAAQVGEEIHAEILKQGLLGKDLVLGNALVDMYAKCGALVKARQLFDELPVQEVVSWTALIAGYAQHGLGEEALNCFECMQRKGFSPDAVTCTCIVDVFGRAGQFDKVMAVIKNMPLSYDLVVWFALLSACQTWGNEKLGRYAFEHAVQLDKKSAVPYVCMSSIYAASGMQGNANKIEALRVKNEAWKKPACCWWTDLSGIVQSFCVGDQTHSESEKIYAKLEDIAQKILLEGYCPNLQLGSQYNFDDAKEDRIVYA